MGDNKHKLGEILIRRKYITRKQLNHALKDQKNRPIGEVLIEMGYVKDEEITQALNEQTIAQRIQEGVADAVKNPIQHKFLWFIVVFSIAGIAFIYNNTSETSDETSKNKETNIVQDLDINAVKVKEKRLRLKYLGHNAALDVQQDSLKNLRNYLLSYENDMDRQVRNLDNNIEELADNTEIEITDLNDGIEDLSDGLRTYKSTNTIQINSLKNKNKKLEKRVKDLEKELADLKKRVVLKEE